MNYLSCLFSGHLYSTPSPHPIPNLATQHSFAHLRAATVPSMGNASANENAPSFKAQMKASSSLKPIGTLLPLLTDTVRGLPAPSS